MVGDAMRQILDFFELLNLAGGSEAELIAWEVISVSMNSPLTVTARAVPKVAGIDAVAIARREKNNIAYSFSNIIKGERIPNWMNDDAREKAKSFLKRNTNGVGRTDIVFYENARPLIVKPRAAKQAFQNIERYERSLIPVVHEVDLSRVEYGSIEAKLNSLTSWYGKPAIVVKERLSKRDITCVLRPEVAHEIGKLHSWVEIWVGKRVMVSGRLNFQKDGRLQLISADHIEIIDQGPIKFEDIADPNFTGGLGVRDYLNQLWGEDID
ncbi:hypothetical protein [Methylobacterium nonmethylotrophicum]|uniref:Uncharacterized protein n=1 Tax=Methylobacterium nonmethylotrophicum TaxID=1141884 RepID=A0A4Z0NNH3_9HYPH|nr:hypothetical protein [Methylobacterium nonmethylotrophicum]TGD98245.1 hypothetical protein EU555_16170 [Methylobacterium nonmethylotrophicum]